METMKKRKDLTMKKKLQTKKESDLIVTLEFLNKRIKKLNDNGFGKAKWISFCEAMIEQGFEVVLCEAKTTVSKYVFVHKKENKEQKFKVRFSNHKPNKKAESINDCDFYVGHTNERITTTNDAIRATLRYFSIN